MAVHRVVKNVKQRGQYIEPHSHTFFHYIYSLRGHTRVTADGEVYQTEPGSLVLLPPGVTHDIVSEDTSCCLDLKFSCSEHLASQLAELPRYMRAVGQRENDLIRNVFEEAVGQERDYDEIINIRLYELLIILLRKKDGGEKPWLLVGHSEASRSNENIRRVLQTVEEELDHPIKVSELAEQCRVQRELFPPDFPGMCGSQPQCLYQPVQAFQGKELMLYSELNVSQIAESLGYQSIHYFSRLFKKVVGIAPTDYVSRIKDNRPINILHNANTPEGEFEIPVPG